MRLSVRWRVFLESLRRPPRVRWNCPKSESATGNVPSSRVNETHIDTGRGQALNKRDAPPAKAFAGTNWARDDYMLDAKMDDWDDAKPVKTAKDSTREPQGQSAFLYNKKNRKHAAN